MNVFFQPTDNNTASLTDKFSYLPSLKAKLPMPKQHMVTPAVRAYPAVSVMPTKFQLSNSTHKSFSFSPDNSAQAVCTSKACSSMVTKPQPSSLPESSYYHEVDSDFLDFDSWFPDLSVSMVTPLSPPDRDIRTPHPRTSMQPQSSSSSYRREQSSTNTVPTTIKSIPAIKTDQNNNKQITNTTKQTNAKLTATSSIPRNDMCSFFTAGSTK